MPLRIHNFKPLCRLHGYVIKYSAFENLSQRERLAIKTQTVLGFFFLFFSFQAVNMFSSAEKSAFIQRSLQRSTCLWSQPRVAIQGIAVHVFIRTCFPASEVVAKSVSECEKLEFTLECSIFKLWLLLIETLNTIAFLYRWQVGWLKLQTLNIHMRCCSPCKSSVFACLCVLRCCGWFLPCWLFAATAAFSWSLPWDGYWLQCSVDEEGSS